MRLLGLVPVRLVAMRDAQGSEGALQDDLRMRPGIAEDMHQILAVPFLADITHARRNPPWIEAELAGTGGPQEIEEFIGFAGSAHGKILSLRRGRYTGSASHRIRPS
jgi:hypothetical protein